MHLLSIALLGCLFAISGIHGLFFFLEGSQSKCFVEDLPKDMMAVVNFEIEAFSQQKNAFEVVANPNVLVSVTEASSGHRISEQDASAHGRVVFTASEAGNHLVCFKHSTSGFFSNKRSKVTVEVLIGEHGAEISPEVDSRLKGLPGAVRSLNNIASEVRREQSDQRMREMKFRDRSEAVNSRAVWYTIFQMIILGLIGLYQVRYLKRFFQSKKLV